MGDSISFKIIILSAIVYITVVGTVAFLMYDSLLFVLPLGLFYPLFLRWIKKNLKAKRDERIVEEFLVFLTSVSGALNAGYALENTVKVAIDDLEHEYDKEESLLIPECEEVIRKLSIKISFENAITEMSDNLGNKDIIEFAKCLSLAKSLGGNIIELIDLTVEMLKDKTETRADISLMISAKRLEKNIMLAVPFFMIGFLRISNPGYLDIMYGNAAGIIVMTVCLIVIVVAFFISEKIIDIKV